MPVKKHENLDVLTAARQRIKEALESTERTYIAFSGGKDSSVMFHLVMEQAIPMRRKVGVMYIDFEAQYKDTIDHVEEMFALYEPYIDPHWICVPTLLRNAVTNYEPQWVAWDDDKKDMWVREKPVQHKSVSDYPFHPDKMEFEEFIVAFGEWYSQGKETSAFIGIRAQESLHRYCAIMTWAKEGRMLNDKKWTTEVSPGVYNVYPIYDWLVDDIWRYHSVYPSKPHNKVYDKMQMAGVKLSQQRLCQPYGDDQRRGLWLYHILEPDTWAKLVVRVSGVNSGSLYVGESGSVSGYNKISKPEGHTWKSFCNMLLQTMPEVTRRHYIPRFKKFIHGWKQRGYSVIPDEAPPELESKQWAPSWRRMCKCLLRNDYWCKGLGQTQPKSDAWQKFKQMKKEGRLNA